MVIALALISARAVNMPIGPFTFVGRVMDAEHAVLGAATIRAERDGVKIAECTTFHRDDSVYNYCLPIQLSDRPAAGYAQVNDPLTLVVRDQYGKMWVGLVSAADARVGKSGTVRKLNIVLADNVLRDGVQVDRELYDYLRALWEESEYYRDGEDFNVTRDYDGDGVPTIKEAYAGTDPYDKNDNLRIDDFRAFQREGHTIVFTVKPGRAYVIESCDDLKGIWSEIEFSVGEDSPTFKALNVREDDYDETKTVYLLPVEGTHRFFRVRQY